MGRFRKILAAVDGSESSRNAFMQACSVARAHKSWVTVLTVVPGYNDVFDPRNVRNDVGRALRGEGTKILDSYQAIADKEDIYIKTVIDEGPPVEKILRAADDGGFDLIVLGRRGKTRLEMALMGGTASRVTAVSEKNVLVVPKGAGVGWGKILVASDGSLCGMNAVERAFELAEMGGGELIAVSVVDVTREFQAQAPGLLDEMLVKSRGLLGKMEGKAKAAGIRFTGFLKEGEPHTEITKLASSQGADLIVMGSHGRKGINRLLMGSVTERVIGTTKVPVLVVK